MKKFLIADDSQGKIDIALHYLHEVKFPGEILIAYTTEHARALIDEHPEIAFAFIDYYIPSHNGPAIIAYLKQSIPTARIALVSSSDNKENQQEAMAAGAETAICTSYALDEVERTIVDLLKDWVS